MVRKKFRVSGALEVIAKGVVSGSDISDPDFGASERTGQQAKSDSAAASTSLSRLPRTRDSLSAIASIASLLTEY